MTPRRLAIVPLAVTIALTACENSLGPESVRSVEVQVDRTILLEGENTSISVLATDIDGGTISGSEVTWVSRDPTTVRVDDGSLFAVAPGVTRILADVRGARDSVRIRVRFGDLSRGEIGLRLQGDGGIRQATDGITVMRRILALNGLPTPGPRTEISTRIGNGTASDTGLVNPVFAQPDTLVWITFEGDPVVGPRQLPAFEVDTLNGTLILRGFEGAMVRIIDRDQPFRTELFTPINAVDLEIDEVVMPEEPGAQGGLLRGAVAFEAAGVIIETDTASHTVEIVGPVSDTTLRIYAEFVTDLYQSLSGTASVSATHDGETSSGFTGATAFAIHDGAEFRLAISTPEGVPTRIFSLHTRLEPVAAESLAVGVLDADAFDPASTPTGTWSHATIYPAVQGAVSPDETLGFGYSTGGDIVLTEYTAPGSNTYGLMRGTYSISYALHDAANAPTGDSLDVTAEFLIPIRPICGFIACN